MPTRSSVAASWGIAITALASSLGPATVRAQELHLDQGAARVARFGSRTQLDDFEGTTEKIDGYVLLRGGLLASAAADDAEMYFEVDLASLTTGIGLRDRHMRDNYLEVRKYPYASFRGRIVRTEVHADGRTQVTATGTFTVHGVSREREIACDVATLGEGYEAQCAFEVLLADHGIEIPRVMFLKVAPEIHVAVAFTLSPPESPHRESRRLDAADATGRGHGTDIDPKGFVSSRQAGCLGFLPHHEVNHALHRSIDSECSRHRVRRRGLRYRAAAGRLKGGQRGRGDRLESDRGHHHGG